MANPIKPEVSRAFKVLSIDELSRLGDGGGVEKFYRHRIKTRGGTIMTVDIAAADFTADKVAPVLDARAAEADKILGL